MTDGPVEMDRGADDQDSAVAEFLAEHPEDYLIEEIEDRDRLGIIDEIEREDPDLVPETPVEDLPLTRREGLARLLKAEELAERLDGGR